MHLPDFFLLSKIKAQYAYCDKKSKELATGAVKPKYKLAGNIIDPLKIYTFFVATKNRFACQQKLTIEVQKQHWEQLRPGNLNNPVGYIDITKFEALTAQELLNKIKDRDNGFPMIAMLCDIKFQELKNLRSRAHMSNSFMTLESTVLIKFALDDVVDLSQISDDLIKRLGLN